MSDHDRAAGRAALEGPSQESVGTTQRARLQFILAGLPYDQQVQMMADPAALSAAAAGHDVSAAAAVQFADDGSKKKLSSGDYGKIIGWGTGQSDDAVEQTKAVTASLSPAAIQGMVDKGLVKSWVQDQLAQYNRSLNQGGKKLQNKQLEHRKALMEKLLELWP